DVDARHVGAEPLEREGPEAVAAADVERTLAAQIARQAVARHQWAVVEAAGRDRAVRELDRVVPGMRGDLILAGRVGGELRRDLRDELVRARALGLAEVDRDGRRVVERELLDWRRFGCRLGSWQQPGNRAADPIGELDRESETAVAHRSLRHD